MRMHNPSNIRKAVVVTNKSGKLVAVAVSAATYDNDLRLLKVERNTQGSVCLAKGHQTRKKLVF
jgi:hypothetical protein